MMSADRALVWLKRDLRVRDHAPLAEARRFDAAAALFVIEPDWLGSPDCDAGHVAFARDALTELRTALAARGLPLLVRVGRMPDMLDAVRGAFGFTHLLSHEETGPGWSYARDRRVAAWCRMHGVVWQEMPQTGVIRRLRGRDGWAARWDRRMRAAEADSDGRFPGIDGIDQGHIPTLAELGLNPHGRRLQPAGEAAAQATLTSFLAGRGQNYRRDLSSPLTAEAGCSRISPHLAFGTLSLRTVHHATAARIAAAPVMAYALRGFAGRLRWHCHFMQKLEDEPQIEFRNFARSCDGLRDEAPDPARLAAWQTGQTGYPMVDACMRSLVATGWLNFRMRAMLTSFAAYHLWLHWRAPGLFLARQFLDFEAGIHWSQMQMQSGTTGINTLRIYSPTRQAREQDPHGQFIRRWVPELARVPLPLLAEPWRMDLLQQREAGCRIGGDYPAPIVDDAAAVAQAKQRLYGLRSRASARAEADAIQEKHGSRKSGLPPTARRRRAPAQPDLLAMLPHET